MTQRIALVLSAGIAACLLTIAVAIATRPTATGGATGNIDPSSPAPVLDVSGSAPASLDPGVQALIDAHDSAYRQRLQQANQELQQANAQLQQAYSQLQALAVPPPTSLAQPADVTASPTAVVYPVSPEQAVAIALSLAQGASLARQPEVVDFQGKVAYEVQLDRGSVYIDANSKQVLYNGTTKPVVSAAPATSSGATYTEQEHEESGDD